VKRKQADSGRIDDLLIGILREDSRASNTDIATGVDIPGMVIDHLTSLQKR
jgi:hypothetical protein